MRWRLVCVLRAGGWKCFEVGNWWDLRMEVERVLKVEDDRGAGMVEVGIAKVLIGGWIVVKATIGVEGWRDADGKVDRGIWGWRLKGVLRWRIEGEKRLKWGCGGWFNRCWEWDQKRSCKARGCTTDWDIGLRGWWWWRNIAKSCWRGYWGLNLKD